MVSVGTRSDSGGEEIFAEFLLKERGGGGRILVSERVRPDLPDELRRGRQITINGHDAWLDTTSDGIALAWQEGGVVIVFAARGTSEDEVIRVAESMEVQGAIRASRYRSRKLCRCRPAAPNAAGSIDAA